MSGHERHDVDVERFDYDATKILLTAFDRLMDGAHQGVRALRSPEMCRVYFRLEITGADGTLETSRMVDLDLWTSADRLHRADDPDDRP